MKSLLDIVAATKGKLIGSDGNYQRICTDSRNLRSGDLFIALRGERFDAHDFLAAAESLGASALVVESASSARTIPQIVVADTTLALGDIARAYRQSFNGQVIGITGSGGKTSVKGMLGEILNSKAAAVVTEKNYNNHIGVPLTLFRLADQKHAVVEMGTSHPGEIAYLTDIVRPDIALVTNIMPAHIGGFGSLEAIAREKSEIYRLLNEQQWAVINADDEFAELFKQRTNGRLFSFSLAEADRSSADLVAAEIRRGDHGSYRFTIKHGAQSIDVELRVPGKHMVANALAAASCALIAGCDFEEIAVGLNQYSGEKGRMEVKSGWQQSVLIDDSYNANPGSVRAAIDCLAECSGKKILVLGNLGELGEKALDAHKELGEYARHKGIDALYTLGEAAALAAREFGEGGMSYNNKTELVDDLKTVLDEHTTALVKGSRSAHMDQVCDALLAPQGESQC